MLGFYHAKLAPVLAFGANLVWRPAPQWFVDASVLAAILFFLFCIAQARKAMAPYEPGANAHKDGSDNRLGIAGGVLRGRSACVGANAAAAPDFARRAFARGGTARPPAPPVRAIPELLFQSSLPRRGFSAALCSFSADQLAAT